MPETAPETSRIAGDPNVGNETITAPAGVASLSGEGGPGGDWLYGNDKDNRYYIVDPLDRVIEPTNGGIDTMIGWQYLKAAPNIENLIVHNNLNNAYGNDLDNLIITDSRSWMYGGKGNDVLVGVTTTTSTYVVRAGEGNDVIYNWAGNSQLQLWDPTMKTASDVTSHMAQKGSDVVLTLSTNETLTFRDTTLASFQSKQFLLTLDRSKLGVQTFGDEFNSLQLYDQSTGTGKWNAVFPNNPKDIWSYSLPSNGEQEVYVTPDFYGSGDHALEINPFSINNGVLTITSQHLTQDQQVSTWGREYASGMINTLDLFEQKYGYFEARMELPQDVQGAWPAFWTVPWPYTGGQEGDIMEALSSRPNYDYRRAYGATEGDYLFDNALKIDPTGFHKYGMLWTKDTVTFYYDDVAVVSGPTPSSWTAPMAMILNLATGGGWPGVADPADFPAGINIDYVHAYALADGSTVVSQQTPTSYAAVMKDDGVVGSAASIKFQDTGQAVGAAPVVLLSHAPTATDIPTASRAFMVWEDGGAVHAAQATNGVLDARTTIIAGTISQFQSGTFLSDGKMAVTYLQQGNPGLEAWVAVLDPVTHKIARQELGDATGGVKIVALEDGGFVASWHTAAGVEGRAYDAFAYDGLGYYAPTRALAGDVTGVTAAGDVLAGGQAYDLVGHQLSPIGAQISIDAATVTHAEGSTGATTFNFTLTRANETWERSTVGWVVVPVGTKPADAADFVVKGMPSGVATFDINDTTKTISIQVAGDTTTEGDEQFQVVLVNPENATLGATTTAIGVITNDDGGTTPPAAPTIALTTSTLTKAEGASGSTAFAYTVTRSGDTSAASTVHWAVTGSGANAANASDFTGNALPAGDLSFAAGETTKTITVNVAGDTAVENNEGFTVTLSGATNAALGAATATGVITNDDGTTPPAAPTIALTTSTVTHAEGASGSTAFAYTVTRSGDTSGASTVHWAVTGSGTNAASASDFTGAALPAGDLSFAAGETTKTITVNVAGDTAVETDEGFTVTLSGATGATLGTATATGLITNDDTSSGGGTSGQVYTASQIRSTFTGTAGNDTFNGSEAADTLTGGAGADLFHFGVKPWEPTHITDFQVGADKLDLSALLQAVGYTGSNPIADQYISFASNGAGGTKVLFDRDGAATGQQWPDRIIELDNLAYNPANASQMLGTSVGSGGGATPPAAPTIALTTSTVTHAEGASGSTAFAYTVTRSGDTSGASTVHWAVTGSGTNAASASDFTGAALPAGDLSFAAGETTKTITVNVAGDTAVETDEGFTVTLSGATGATLGTATATGLITNDDTSSGGGTSGQVYTASQIRSTFTGTAGNDTFNGSEAADTLTGGAGADLFHFGVKPWEPTHITDFQVGADKLDLSALLQAVGYTGSNPIADQYISFASNGAGGTKVLFDRDGAATGQQWPDRIIELDNLAYNPANASQMLGTSVGSGGGTTPPAAPTIALTTSTVTHAEGASGSTAFAYTVTRSGDTSGASTVHWAVTGSGTNAASATDFTGAALPAGDLSFAAGETVKTITVNVAGDTAVETDEGFTVTLSGATGATLGTATATGLITNDDATTTPTVPTIALTTSTVSHAEGASGSTAFAYTVTRSGDTSAASTVHWGVTGSGTNAANAADFTGGTLPGGDLSFAAGETVKTITVNVAGDTAVETDEGFTVTLSGATGATLGAASATGLITNDDSAGSPGGGSSDSAYVLFAGQSNIGGNYTTASQVDADWKADPLTLIWNHQTNAWEQMVPGQNTGWSNSGLENSWGPEVEFAIKFREAYPDKTLYILKQADGGTTLAHDWDPDVAGGLFDNVTSLVGRAGAALGGRMPDTLFWGQGETDGNTLADAQAYGQNLTEFLAQARTEWLGDSAGKVSLFRIDTSPPYSVYVRQGQLAVDQADANVVSFDTISFPTQSDNLHFSPAGLDMAGASFFDAYAGWQSEPRVGLITSAVYKDEGQSGGTAFSYTLARTGDTSGAMTVNWSVTGSGSNAASASDFVGGALPGGAVTFAAGETTKTIVFSASADTTAEASEHFTLTLTGAGGALIGVATAEGTIVDDDSTAKPAAGTNGSTVTGSAQNSVLTGTSGTDTLNASSGGDTLTGGAAADIFVFKTAQSTPATITDFTPGTDKIDVSKLLPASYHGDAVSDLYVVMKPDGTGGANLYLDVDGGGQGTQNFLLVAHLTGVSPWVLTGSDFIVGSATGALPQIGFSGSTVTHAEGNSGSTTYAYTVTRSGDASSISTVHWAVSGSGGNPANAADFTGSAFGAGDLSFAAGETSKIVTVTVAGDTLVEPDETFTVTLSNVSGATLGASTIGGVITADDVDTGSNQVLTATSDHSRLTGGSGNDTLNASVAGDTLTGGGGSDLFHFGSKPWEPAHITDFQLGADKLDLSALLQAAGYAGTDPVADQVVVFMDNGAGGTKVLFDRDGAATGQQWPDRIIEIDNLAYSPSNSSQILGTSVSIGGGTTPPAGPTIALTTASVSHAEGASGSTAFAYTLTRSGDTSAASSVHWAVTGSGTNAASAADFTGAALPGGDVSFAAGETAKTITVNVAGDTTVENDEAFTVTLSAATGATLGTATATGVITNDDASGPGQVFTAPSTYATMTGTSGNDTFNGSEGGDTITGGAGADLFYFAKNPWDITHITDFSLSGDKLDVSAILDSFGYTGSDPIGDKYIWLMSDGAGGTKVLFDRDGTAPGQEWPNYAINLDHVDYATASSSTSGWLIT